MTFAEGAAKLAQKLGRNPTMREILEDIITTQNISEEEMNELKKRFMESP